MAPAIKPAPRACARVRCPPPPNGICETIPKLPKKDADRTETITAVMGDVGVTPEAARIAASEGAEAEIRAGDCLGRYTVRSLIGAGGMGQVFAAFDPELGRTIALKLIHPDRMIQSPIARARLLREAQALARLHHPNVVTVHDVGTDGDQVFVAMELVEGPTLSEWLRAGERSWREVLVPFLAAGRGLAAAHAAGIVHRDVKPANVIVGKERVVVLDFGLARAGRDDDEPLEPPARKSVLETNLTLTGERMGTPLYMAPEQHSGGAVTAKADQFAFCVGLWEGLHRSRPDGPARAEVPGRVNAAVRRGLAPDPADRWPSMDTLLTALARDPTATRWRLAGAATVVALGVVAVWGLLRSGIADPCTGGAARLAGVWDGPRKDAVRAAFAATQLPFSDDAWRGASARLDGYAARWVDMYGQTCRATRVDGRQSDTLMDLRMACLDRRHAVLGALTDLWAKGMDRESLSAAIEAADGLPTLSECADARALTERIPLPSDPAVAAKVAAARARVDGALALSLAHRWPEAKTAAAEARALADATGWANVRAEAAFAEGDVGSDLQEPGAEATLLDAARLAGEARDDHLAARALVELSRHVVETQLNAERALLVADVAAGMVVRAGNDALLRGRILRNRGQAYLLQGKHDLAQAAFVLSRAITTAAFGGADGETLATVNKLANLADAQGDYVGARALGEKNLTDTIAILGADHPRVAAVLNNLASTLSRAGDFEAAAGYYRRALPIMERVSGPESPAVAIILQNLGGLELMRGHLDPAEALLVRALAIREHALGPEHPHVATSLSDLAEVRRKQGRYQESLDLLERALPIYQKAYGPQHVKVAFLLVAAGYVFEAKGDAAGALGYYQRALAIRKQALGGAHAVTLDSTNQVARTLAALNRCDEAGPLIAGALAGLEKAVGPDHPQMADALLAAARCDLAAGQAARAVTALERVMVIGEKSEIPPVDRGIARWLLARALWAAGRRDEAVAAARLAEQELAGDADGARDRAAARAWLAKHG